MTLYGLDLIVNQEGRPYLGEINGICSGMGGFTQVYGDTRIKDKVSQMLQEKYGALTVNDGTYQRERFKREHPFQYHWKKIIARNKQLQRVFNPLPKIWFSKKSLIHWLLEDVKDMKKVSFPFAVYQGQDSRIVNVINDSQLAPSAVNPFVAE